MERSTTTLDDHVAGLTWPWLNKGIIQPGENDPVTGSKQCYFCFLN